MTKPSPQKRSLKTIDYQTLATFRYELRCFLNFSQKAAKKNGLTPQQHQALLAIRSAAANSMTIGELADRLLLRPHSASELTDRLALLGLVERTPSELDRRITSLHLTPKAEDILASLSLAHRDELRRIRPLLTELLGNLD
ncbi:MAG: MarR family transcriptional regulator [Acidocella sp. 20-57-95]|nr:MAG: MarR family transcriptional regulator [Acidocella sp. 20-57-95]